MSVYIDVWHRTHPLTPANHERFLDYYGEFVVAPPSDYFEVVSGFRYTDGPSNEDFALYRFASMAAIEESMMSFGADPAFVAASDALFAEIEIEETRGVAMHTPYAPEARLDVALAEACEGDGHRFVRIVRTCGGTVRPRAFELLADFRDQVEKASDARLVVGLHYIVGPVMDLVEIWRLPAERPGSGLEEARLVEASLAGALAEVASERERRGIAPTAFSKLR